MPIGREQLSGLDYEQQAELFRHAFATVDGLWFTKVEEQFGFDKALEIDDEVWKVQSKIQARAVKSLLKAGNGMQALLLCLSCHLSAGGFRFETEQLADADGFQIIIQQCPWHNAMRKSERAHLSDKVGRLICNTEYSAWAAQFGEDMLFSFGERICAGASRCVLNFAVVVR